MRYYLTFLLFLSHFVQLFGQFSDNFTDGDFTAAPAWIGNTSDFSVTSGELKLTAPSISGKKYLSTNSQSINNAIWEFKVRMTFGTSSSNFSKIYLASSSSYLSGSLNGYFVMIGGTDDEVSLYSQTGTSTTKIINGRNSTVGGSTVDLTVRVSRSNSGLWEIFSDTSSSVSSFISEGTITDNNHTQSLFFGVECNFTSTRSTRFYFDDFSVTGNAAVDNVKPTLDSVFAISNTQLQLVFSEPLDPTSSQLSANYSANNGFGNPILATQNPTDFSRILLTFSSPFGQGITHILSVNNVSDIAGNRINSTSKNFVYFIPSIPNYREVVINEIFADPSPVVGLPDAEFIELHNPTPHYFELNNWKITDGSSTSNLPSYTLAPNSFVILCSNSTLPDFSAYSNTIGLSSFPSLNNAGETITLLDDSAAIIDAVEFSLPMYKDPEKDDGGYTLEQINPQSNCFNPSNWASSSNPNGGTPGTANSVLDFTPNTTKPRILKCIATSNSTLEITFDKTIDTAVLLSNLTISDGISVSSSLSLNDFSTRLELTITPIMDTGKVYFLEIDSLIDCEGNLTSSESEFVLANQNQTGAIIINEILFNPYAGDEDFVELYNNSNLYLDLINWQLGNEDNGSVGNLKSIEESYILKPKEYVVITKNVGLIKSRYPSHSESNFIEMETLPTYANEAGTVYILLPLGDESDKFEYSEEFHFDLLRDKEGVSLERLDFDKATQDKFNWHSAAEEVGFATPGIKNSQYTPVLKTDKILRVSPDIFSPDNDGFEDILTLTYNLPEVGFVGNVTIFDSKGRQTKVLVQNQLLAQQGSFTWDGTTDENQKARIGRYIILFEYFDLEGNVKTRKTTCVVGHKL